MRSQVRADQSRAAWRGMIRRAGSETQNLSDDARALGLPFIVTVAGRSTTRPSNAIEWLATIRREVRTPVSGSPGLQS